MDTISELPINSGIENGSFVFYLTEPNQGEQINGDVQATIARRKPKKPRALAYQFFEWEEESSRYKCKICAYVLLLLTSEGLCII